LPHNWKTPVAKVGGRKHKGREKGSRPKPQRRGDRTKM